MALATLHRSGQRFDFDQVAMVQGGYRHHGAGGSVVWIASISPTMQATPELHFAVGINGAVVGKLCAGGTGVVGQDAQAAADEKACSDVDVL